MLHFDLNAERLGAGADDINGLRVAVFIDPEDSRLRLHREREAHRLSGGGGFIKKRGISDIEPRELGDQGLEVEERFESALGNLRLIRSVSGIPAGILKNVPLNHRRGHSAVIALTDERFEDFILTQLLF